VLTRADVERIARICQERDIWLISDEAYEDVVFDGEHVSAASLPGMYDRTISFFTFSKSYAMTGLRLGYVVARDPAVRDRMKKVLFYSAGNVSSIVQFGGIGALEGSQESIDTFRTELKYRRDMFYEGIRASAAAVLSGEPPPGAFYAFLKISDGWQIPADSTHSSRSWAMTEFLISQGRIGCVPGVDFGAQGEGYIRFCFARDREELTGALDSMRALFSA
jgi:aspartate aminotransferase